MTKRRNGRYLAPHITNGEYRCGCCFKLPIDFFNEEDEIEIGTPYLMLFKYFQDIRTAWGKPIPISSGYRCSKYNEEVGGKPCSVHTFGLALDLDCKDVKEVSKLALLIKQIAPQLRVGIYKKAGSFIHIDVGYYIYPRLKEEWHEGARWSG